MKHPFKLLALLSFLTLAVTSCDKEETDDFIVYDYSPVSINIALTDSQGNSLFDIATPNNLLDCDIYVTYEDKRWDMDNVRYNDRGFKDSNVFQYEKTRIYVPTFYGLYLNNYRQSETGVNIAALEFGPMEGGVHGTVEYTLHIPELDRTYDCRIITTKKGYNADYKFIVNGKEYPSATSHPSGLYTEIIPDSELATIKK